MVCPLFTSAFVSNSAKNKVIVLVVCVSSVFKARDLIHGMLSHNYLLPLVQISLSYYIIQASILFGGGFDDI